ncbi:MAG: histidine phosphatase family protein [candidate division NC10 bacterium]|nr:histidine phosphatase family protein [candidate division NC10 bacterium]
MHDRPGLALRGSSLGEGEALATRIYLIRHGETVSSYDGRGYGQTDLPLSEWGRQQMARLGQRLLPMPPQKIYCSDLARSRESAQILGRPWGLTPIICPELREIHMGLWEGLSYEEIRRLDPEKAAQWATASLAFHFPEGEGLRDLKSRVLPAYQKLIEEAGDEIFAIVGHAGPNRVILCHALGICLSHFWRLGQDHGGLSIIDYHGRSAMVSLLNFREGMWGRERE